MTRHYKKNYNRYGIMAEYGPRIAYHASTISELLSLAKNIYTGDTVILWSSSNELKIRVEKTGFYDIIWNRITIKKISHYLNLED